MLNSQHEYFISFSLPSSSYKGRRGGGGEGLGFWLATLKYKAKPTLSVQSWSYIEGFLTWTCRITHFLFSTLGSINTCFDPSLGKTGNAVKNHQMTIASMLSVEQPKELDFSIHNQKDVKQKAVECPVHMENFLSAPPPTYFERFCSFGMQELIPSKCLIWKMNTSILL